MTLRQRSARWRAAYDSLDAIDGRAWAGASRSEVVDLIFEAAGIKATATTPDAKGSTYVRHECPVHGYRGPEEWRKDTNCEAVVEPSSWRQCGKRLMPRTYVAGDAAVAAIDALRSTPQARRANDLDRAIAAVEAVRDGS